MVRWMQANLNRGELDGHRILKDSTYDLIWKGTEAFKNVRVGISWFLTDHKGQQVVMHGGQDDGFLTTLVLLPARKTAWWYSSIPDWHRWAIERKAFRVALGEE